MAGTVIQSNGVAEMTPTRKRKREAASRNEHTTTTHTEKSAPVACFTNAAFSSTPKKAYGKRRSTVTTTTLPVSKENLNPFVQNNCMEVKSIADILYTKTQAAEHEAEVPTNPYEVQRKPPKKKKRQNDNIEEACFENPALNLEMPEKQFNPYEVIRTPPKQEQCFVNQALNIRGPDQTGMRNPYEVKRESTAVAAASAAACSQLNSGIENPCLDDNMKVPSSLKICLPFTPTVGCRIDFKNMSLSQLTPTQKLVFSPVLAPAKRSLGSISEEESSVSIGKELDRYQLELENSINEAKLRKNGNIERSPPLPAVAQPSPNKQLQEMHFKMELEQKITFTQKLEEITEEEEMDDVGGKATNIVETIAEERQQIEGIISYDTEHLHELKIGSQATQKAELNEAAQMNKEVSVENNNNDVAYASESEDEDQLDFKAPAPFVRAYRTAGAATKRANSNSKESLNTNKSDKSNEPDKHIRSSVKQTLRNSIRKLMHPNASSKTQEKEKDQPTADTKHTNFIDHLRHSLRRKPPTKPFYEQSLTTEHDVSIIDSSERTMKLKSFATQNEYIKIEDLSNEKRKHHSLRSSLRQSTRDMMKNVFHKTQEGYALNK